MSDPKFPKYGRAARDLYVKHNRTIKEIADLLDISDKSIGEWCKAGHWVDKRKRHLLRPAEIAEFAEDILYTKMEQLRDMPADKIDAGLLDGIDKLMKRIREFRSHTGLLDRAVDVMDHYLTHCKVRLDTDAITAQVELINDFLTTLETV